MQWGGEEIEEVITKIVINGEKFDGKAYKLFWGLGLISADLWWKTSFNPQYFGRFLVNDIGQSLVASGIEKSFKDPYCPIQWIKSTSGLALMSTARKKIDVSITYDVTRSIATNKTADFVRNSLIQALFAKDLEEKLPGKEEALWGLGYATAALLLSSEREIRTIKPTLPNLFYWLMGCKCWIEYDAMRGQFLSPNTIRQLDLRFGVSNRPIRIYRKTLTKLKEEADKNKGWNQRFFIRGLQAIKDRIVDPLDNIKRKLELRQKLRNSLFNTLVQNHDDELPDEIKVTICDSLYPRPQDTDIIPVLPSEMISIILPALKSQNWQALTNHTTLGNTVPIEVAGQTKNIPSKLLLGN